MFKRQDLDGKEMQVVQHELQENLAQFAAKVEQMSMEELNAEEASLVQMMNEYDNYLNEVKYDLPPVIEFMKETYSRKNIGEIICEFVNDMEVEFSYTIGLLEMYKLWKKIDKTISFHEYDSTVRVLGQRKYKGVRQWEKIMAVDEFFKNARTSYGLDTIYINYMAELHNAVLNKMKALGEADIPDEIPTQD